MPIDLFTRLDPLRRLQCPFCFERFAAFEMHVKCESRRCETDPRRHVEDPILTRAFYGPDTGASARGPWWVNPRADRRRGFRRHFDWLLLPDDLACPNCGERASNRLCPHCHRVLPREALHARSGHVAIFGPQSVGKTTYMTVMLYEFDQQAGPEHGLILQAANDETTERYRHEYHDVTYGSSLGGVGEVAGVDSTRQAHEPTAPLEMSRRWLVPLVYVVKRRGQRGPTPLLSFSDMAGDDWEMNFAAFKREAGHLIRRAKGLLFLIDPLRIPQVAADHRLTLTPKEAHVRPANYREDLEKLSSLFDNTPVSLPLAICLNKLDRWGPLLSENTTLHELAHAVPGTELPNNLDQLVHEDVRAALRQWGQLSFLEHLEIDFPTHRFFACSALGDAAQEDEAQAQPLPTPLLVERPLIWLLRQQKLIR